MFSPRLVLVYLFFCIPKPIWAVELEEVTRSRMESSYEEVYGKNPRQGKVTVEKIGEMRWGLEDNPFAIDIYEDAMEKPASLLEFLMTALHVQIEHLQKMRDKGMAHGKMVTNLMHAMQEFKTLKAKGFTFGNQRQLPLTMLNSCRFLAEFTQHAML